MTDPRDLIARWQDERRTNLTDTDAKALLAAYDIPIAQEAVAHSRAQALQLGRQIGDAVVLKVISPDILHKSDAGGVRVDVKGDEAIGQAYDEIMANARAYDANARIDGMLIQGYLPVDTELIVGLAPDATFGRVIMFGIGGIFVEIMRDVSFGVVPITTEDAARMIRGIQGYPLLAGARGRTPVDEQALIHILLQLSQMAQDLPQLAELDINPLIARPDGSLVAVDTRAALADVGRPAAAAPRPLDMATMDQIFSPQTLAIIGASNNPDKVGYLFMDDLLKRGYRGKLYPVNPRGGEIMGLTAYPDVTAIPEPVDLAIVAVPTAVVMPVLQQCAEAGVPGVMINTAGFNELGTKAGDALEQEMLTLLRDHDMRAVGPNCLGIYNPQQGLGYLDAPQAPGRIGLISQSGFMTTRIIKFGANHGLGFSKAVSGGNESDLTVEDYIAYLGQDTETDVIAAYVESIKDGQRFLRLAKSITPRKPIIVWKSGHTAAGAQAAASHTGSLAGSAQIYQAAFEQCGVIGVADMSTLFDTLNLIGHLGQVRGQRVAIITGPGGMGVALADACALAGLTVPTLQRATIDRLRAFLPFFAGMRNPVDLTMAQILNKDLVRQAILAVQTDPQIDAFIAVIAASGATEQAEVLLQAHAESHKPILVVLGEPEAECLEAKAMLEAAGIPVFTYPERAARALAAANRRQSGG